MEVAETPAAAAAPGASSETPSEQAERPNALRDRTLKDIISGMKKRRGAKPMPSAVQRAEERRKRRRRLAEGLPEEEAPAQHTTRVATPPPPEEPEEEKEDEVVAPQVTLDEDGNIVIDQASLVVSAGTATNAEAERGDVTTIENHAYTNQITSATYSKRESAMKWSEAETERFYNALRKFGTDFQLMEGDFPKRSRRQLKLKFKREEKDFPQRIDEALNGPPLPLPPVKKTTPANEEGDKQKAKDRDAGPEGEVTSAEKDVPMGEEQPTVVEEAPAVVEEAPTVVEEAPAVVEEAPKETTGGPSQNDRENENAEEKGDEKDDDEDRWSDSEDSEG